MKPGTVGAKCKYSFYAWIACLGLVILYQVYWPSDRSGLETQSMLIENEPSLTSFPHSANELETPASHLTGADQGPKSQQTPTAAGSSAAITQIALELPPEYSILTEGQTKCEKFFTPSYLQQIATHQLPYCKVQSLSAFQCFAAPRLVIPMTAGWGQTDPLCVAQGVSFRPTPDQDSDAEFKLQCQLRDLKSERASSQTTAEEMEGFRDHPTDWGWYWGDTGVGASLKTWEFKDRGDVSGCTKENSSSEWIMLMRRDSTDTHNLWHKLMEILQARHSLDALRIAINPATGAPWLSEKDAVNVQLVFDDDRQELLQPLWETVTGKKPVRKSSLQASCFGNVILPLPGCGSPFWSALLDTGYPEHCPSQTLLNTFVDRVFSFYSIEPRSVKEIHEHPTITIVERKENRKFISLDRWTAALRGRYPKSQVNVVDFSSISIEEQLRLVQSTDVLVGHHGAAMTHIVFMAPQAAAVEILPRYFGQHGFRAIAAMREVLYFAGKCIYKEEYENEVHGQPLPENWAPKRPHEFNHWQKEEWTYMTDDGFLGLVDAAVRSQLNRLSDDDRPLTR